MTTEWMTIWKLVLVASLALFSVLTMVTTVLARIIHQCWATSRKSFSSREVQRSYLEHRAEAGNY